MQQMDKLFMEMDSIKNYYFQQQQFPELKNKKQVPKKSN
jgi:hypothetical protein